MKFQSRYPFLTIAVVLMVSSVLGINHTVSAWGGGGGSRNEKLLQAMEDWAWKVPQRGNQVTL